MSDVRGGSVLLDVGKPYTTSSSAQASRKEAEIVAR